jgi:hypothetical protein
MMAYCNIGDEAKKNSESSVFPIMPVIPYSGIPLFCILDEERRRKR